MYSARRRFLYLRRLRDRGLIKNEIAAARFQGGRLDRASYLICNPMFSASFSATGPAVVFVEAATILRF